MIKDNVKVQNIVATASLAECVNLIMETSIKIRRAKKEDLSKIYSLGRKIKEFMVISDQTRFYSKDELKEWIKKPKDNILLVAIQRNKLVGYLYAKIMSNEWCMLDSLAVIQNYRAKGIGTLLLNQLYTILKKEGINYVQAFVEVENKKARKFWNKKGFQKGKKFVWVEKNL